eukprot:scaffold34615_cov118-Isochrysis_galbana.AAC.1
MAHSFTEEIKQLHPESIFSSWRWSARARRSPCPPLCPPIEGSLNWEDGRSTGKAPSPAPVGLRRASQGPV